MWKTQGRWHESEKEARKAAENESKENTDYTPGLALDFSNDVMPFTL